MRLFLKISSYLAVALLGFSFCAHTTFAATKTICGSLLECDYTSITDAFADDGVAGEEYVVQGGAATPYDPVGETWNLSFPSASSTLSCTGGAIITQPTIGASNRIYLTTDSTVRNCTFGNVQFSSAPPLGGGLPDGIKVLSNTFLTNATGTFELSAGATNFLIADNTNIHHLTLNATSTDGIIRNNTFYGDAPGISSAVLLNTDATTTNLQVLNNTFVAYATSSGSSGTYLQFSGENITFATNTLRIVNDVLDGLIETSAIFNASGTVYIGGNFMDAPGDTSHCRALYIYPQRSEALSANYRIQHNTFKSFRGLCSDGSPIEFHPQFDRSDIAFDFDLDYNIFYNASTTVSSKSGMMINSSLASPSVTQSNSYNGLYRMTGGAIRSDDGAGGGSDLSDASTITSNPFLKVDDADTTNDLQTAAFSPYLDYNGSQDIGATNSARRNTITVSQTGTIDYSTVDATTTAAIGSFARSGDTITLATGTYAAFDLNSSNATSSITIQGVGAGTMIDAVSGANGITFTNVSSSAISNLIVQNASGLSATTYTTTKILGHVGSQDYNEAFGMIGLNAGEMAVFTDSSVCDGGPVFTPVASDGTDITSVTAAGTTSFHLAAVNLMGTNHFTVLLPNNQFSNQTDLQTYLGSVCGLPGPMYSVDAFADNLFTVSGGTYTYDASSLLTSGITLVTGTTDPPAISMTPGAPFAGIKLAGSSNHISISNVTSSNNGNGISFATTANGYNTLADSVLTGSTYYDVVSASNSTNTFDNVSFTRASSSVSGTAPILVKYDARVRLVRQGGSAISGVAASSTSADSTVTSFGSTDGSGYTSYVSLAAHTISNLSNDLTNGGYNPYTMNAVGTSYFSSSTSATLSSPNQAITLVMHSTEVPTAPTSAATSSLATTSATFEWTDNSDDETAFLVDYRAPRLDQSYPATTFLVSTGTSAVVSGLTPGETYEFRVAAINSNGTSTYVTSSEFVLPGATPAAPTLTALSRTSLSLELGANGNATSVEYAIYSSTLGGYLNASSTVTSTAVWQTTSTWSTPVVSDLTCNTSYAFVVVGRNMDSVATATSSAATVTTSACPSAASGGGGGGGGGGGIGGLGFVLPSTPIVSTSTTPSTPASLPVPPSTPAPVPTPPVSPDPVPPVPLPFLDPLSRREEVLRIVGAAMDESAEQRALLRARTDAREFNVPISDTQASRLSLFIAYGVSPETRRLGEGERRALVRDMLETMQRADLSTEDMQRLTLGEIPRMRNLAVERQQLPRVRQTFRTLFGHDPNFQNPQENLAWNTLMYRIRFTRNLTLEQQGIREFRSAFGRSPSTPFQWAAVRVQGYVQR